FLSLFLLFVREPRCPQQSRGREQKELNALGVGPEGLDLDAGSADRYAEQSRRGLPSRRRRHRLRGGWQRANLRFHAAKAVGYGQGQPGGHNPLREGLDMQRPPDGAASADVSTPGGPPSFGEKAAQEDQGH